MFQQVRPSRAGAASHFVQLDRRYEAEFDAQDACDKIGADALTEDAKVEFELLTHVTKFRRCALVSDLSWPKTLANTFGRLIPLLEMKSFHGNQRAEAIAWAAEGPAREKEKPATVAFVAPDEVGLKKRVGL